MKYKRSIRGGLVLGVGVLVMVVLSILWAQAGASTGLTPAVRPLPVPPPPASEGEPFVAARLVSTGARLGPESLPVPQPEATPRSPSNPAAASSGLILVVPLVAMACGLATLKARHGLTAGVREEAPAPQRRLTACRECG